METVEECLQRNGFSKEAEMEIDVRICFRPRTLTYEQFQKIYKHCNKYYWFWKIQDSALFTHRPKEIEVTLLPKDILDIILNYIRPLTYSKKKRKAVDIIPSLYCPVKFYPEQESYYCLKIYYETPFLEKAKSMIQELVADCLRKKELSFKAKYCVTMEKTYRIYKRYLRFKKPKTKKRKIEQSLRGHWID